MAGSAVQESEKPDGFRTLRHGVGIGTKTRYRDEQSDWACAEVIVFNKVLSDAEAQVVERYLEFKYGFV
jgi:hypothetical protein